MRLVVEYATEIGIMFYNARSSFFKIAWLLENAVSSGRPTEKPTL
jgi:hypothetical protein